MSLFRQLLSVKSMIRYSPPKGTAGLARSRVSGSRRVPLPPARITAKVFFIIRLGASVVRWWLSLVRVAAAGLNSCNAGFPQILTSLAAACDAVGPAANLARRELSRIPGSLATGSSQQVSSVEFDAINLDHARAR
jgi:hypothetical protein